MVKKSKKLKKAVLLFISIPTLIHILKFGGILIFEDFLVAYLGSLGWNIFLVVSMGILVGFVLHYILFDARLMRKKR